MTKLFTLDSLNSLPLPAFSGAVGDVFENASWVADAVFGYRPFETVGGLYRRVKWAFTTLALNSREKPLLQRRAERRQLVNDQEAFS